MPKTEILCDHPLPRIESRSAAHATRRSVNVHVRSACLFTLASLCMMAAALAGPPQPPSSAPATRLVHGRSVIRPVQLEPTTQSGGNTAGFHGPSGTNPKTVAGAVSRIPTGAIDQGDWTFRVEKANPQDGVPWRLVATPLSSLAEKLKPADQFKPPERILDVPVTRVPEHVWPQWFEAGMKDVVGIHYHQFIAEGLADLLITIHKVPPDGPDGKPPTAYAGKRGTRIEATLLRPLSYHLDQTIVVREAGQADKDRGIADKRMGHERGHGQLSLVTLLATLAGPADWKLNECTGHRSTLAWYWRTEKIGRAWEGYKGGNGQLATLRTTITLVPPTRWSLLIPLEPDEVSQRQIQAFNDSIVHLQQLYAEVDDAAQKDFHSSHGEFEASPP